MPDYDKIIEKILSGRSDANIKFNDGKKLLNYLDFEMRIKGSHPIFRKEGVKELVNIQKDGNKASPVRYVRSGLFYWNTI